MRPTPNGYLGPCQTAVLRHLAENARCKVQGKKPAVVSPLTLGAVRRIDALFEIERGINGEPPERRQAVRQELSDIRQQLYDRY